jgi:hypothetical protein
MKLGSFQHNQSSQVFEPLVFKGGSHKKIITIVIPKKKINFFENDHFIN